MYRTNLQFARPSKPGFAALILGGIFIAGCLLEPVGTNKAPGSVPTVVPGGTVEVAFRVPEGADKATFKLKFPEGSELAQPEIPEDDNLDDGFVAKIPTTGLPADIYVVQMFIGEEETPRGSRAFVVSDSAATDEEEPVDASPEPSPSAKAWRLKSRTR